MLRAMAPLFTFRLPGSEDIAGGAAAVEDYCFAGVYFLILEGEVVYIGQSTNVLVRVASHRGARKFDSFSWLTCPPEHLNLIESIYIHALRPRFNGHQWNVGRRGPDKSAPIAPRALLQMAARGYVPLVPHSLTRRIIMECPN